MDPSHYRILRLPEVLALVGCSKSTLYSMIARSLFPAPDRTGERMVGWPEYVVVQWLASRPSARPTPTRGQRGIRS